MTRTVMNTCRPPTEDITWRRDLTRIDSGELCQPTNHYLIEVSNCCDGPAVNSLIRPSSECDRSMKHSGSVLLVEVSAVRREDCRRLQESWGVGIPQYSYVRRDVPGKVNVVILP